MNVIYRGVLVCVLASTCAACALMNPYVYPKDKRYSDSVLLPDMPTSHFAGGIGPAITHADKWRHTYVRAASQHATMRNVSAIALIPLSATALFYGVTDYGSSDRIIRLALGGASLHSANQYLTSNPRQELYLQGAHALTCAIAASRPFIVTDEWLKALGDETKVLIDHLATLEQAQVVLHSLISPQSSTPSTEAFANATNASNRAQEAIAEARALASKSEAAQMEIRRSGQTLMNTVRGITDFVDSQIADTQPDLATLRTISTGLGDVAAGFAGSAWPTSGVPAAPSPRAPTTGTDTSRENFHFQAIQSPIDQAHNSVAKAQSDVARSSTPIIIKLESIANVGDQVELVASCTPKDAARPFTITPSSETQTVGVGQFITVEARGGAGIPRYQVLGANTDSIAVTVSTQDLGHLVVIVSGKSEAESSVAPTLVFTDGHGKRRVAVRIAVSE